MTVQRPPKCQPWRSAGRHFARLHIRTSRRGTDTGDVPGWVLVTLMTAGLVVALWALAGPALGNLFMDAVNGVKGP